MGGGEKHLVNIDKNGSGWYSETDNNGRGILIHHGL